MGLLVATLPDGAGAVVDDVLCQRFQAACVGAERVSRLGHSALVVWRPGVCEVLNGFDDFDHLHVVLAVLCGRPQADRVHACVRAVGLCWPSPAGCGRLHAPAHGMRRLGCVR